MNICLEIPAQADARQKLSSNHIQSLARTYDLATDPVRIEDVSGGCLYQNGLAANKGLSRANQVTFDIVDHTNRVVARLCTCR